MCSKDSLGPHGQLALYSDGHTGSADSVSLPKLHQELPIRTSARVVVRCDWQMRLVF